MEKVEEGARWKIEMIVEYIFIYYSNVLYFLSISKTPANNFFFLTLLIYIIYVYIEIFFFLFWNFCVTYILFFFYICCRYELQRRSTIEFTMFGVSTWEIWYRRRMPRLRRFQFNYTRQCRCHNYFRYVLEKASIYIFYKLFIRWKYLFDF